MAEYIYVTDDVLQWFLPLLPESEQKALLEDPHVYAIGAVEDSTACGVMLIYAMEEENVEQLRYLVVGDDYRRQGIGTGMVQYLCRELYEDATLLTCAFGASGKEDPVYRFFADMWNFTIEDEEGYYCRIPLKALKESEKLAGMKGKGRNAVPFFSLPEREQRSFRNKLLEQDVNYLREIPEEDFAKDLCMCCKTDFGDISAAVFMTQESAESDLELACVWGTPNGRKDLMGLFAHVNSLLPDREDRYLNIAAVNDASVSLVEKLFPEREIVRRYYMAAWDMV